MQKPRSLSELLSRPGNKLSSLKLRSTERARIVNEVRGTLPERLAQAVVSAGLEQGRLTVGVTGAAWASRIRYFSDSVRKGVGEAVGRDGFGQRGR